MFEGLEVAVTELDHALNDVDLCRLGGLEALRLVDLCSRAERLLAGTRALAVRRVEETKAWQRDGHRSAGDWMAAATGSHVSDALEMLQTARRLEELPLIRSAFRAGELSEEQVRVISDAAYVDPRREHDLIAAARAETVKALKVECKRVKDAVLDERERLASIHKRRYFRSWIEADGAVRLDARLTPGDGAEVLAAVE